MGIDYDADFGYGFPLTDKKVIGAFNSGALNVSKRFSCAYQGNAYDDDGMIPYIFIVSSAYSASAWSGTRIKSIDLIVKPDWDELLKAEAKKLGQKKPKLGWWLLASVC